MRVHMYITRGIKNAPYIVFTRILQYSLEDGGNTVRLGALPLPGQLQDPIHINEAVQPKM